MNTSKQRLETLYKFLPQLTTVRYGIMPSHFHQSVKDHIEGMIRLAPTLMKQAGLQFNIAKLNAVIIVHDLPELGMDRDITSWELAKRPELQRVKTKFEHETITRLGKTHGSWLPELFEYYEKQDNELTKFVKWLDKYESNLYLLDKAKGHDLNFDWFTHNTQRLVTATLSFPHTKDITVKRLRDIKTLFENHSGLDEWANLYDSLN